MTDPLRLTLQESLGSAFTLKAELGGGGMSRVFVAREEALGRDVVVKVLAPELAEGLSVERFAREIRLAAALQDPHIVPVLMAGTTGAGLPYYTMPFVQGASLRARLNEGLIPLSDAIRLLRDAAQALAYAHARSIVHRDIKPENILLSNGSAVVTDFGLAKALSAARSQGDAAPSSRGITRTGMSLGTPAYMAPEQAAGDPETDQRADLYAWGMVAYEVLAGRHPFADRTSPQQMLAAQIVDVPAALQRVNPAVPHQLAALVMQCLAKPAEQRPASATEVLRALDAMTQNVTVATHRSAPTGRRAWVLAAAGAAAVVALAVTWRTSAMRTEARVAQPAPAEPVMMAVLPFEHAGPADQQPFTDGLTDAVTAKLGALSSLLVIDRRSAATYRGTTKTTQQIGAELGVQYLLEGVVRWAKDGSGAWRARVTPSLVNAKSGAIKWTGEPVDVTLDDPFTAQGSIATDVATAMEVAVLPKERVALKRRFTDNPAAYAAYQRSQDVITSSIRILEMDSDLNQKIIRELETAVALDSSFSAAWGMLAMYRIFDVKKNSADTGPKALAIQTLELARKRAPDEPYVLLAASITAFQFDSDTSRSDRLLDAALASAPHDAFVLFMAAQSLYRSRPDSAQRLALSAARIDPKNVLYQLTASNVLMELRRWAEQRRAIDVLLAADSSNRGAWQSLMVNLRALGDTAGIRVATEGMRRNVPDLHWDIIGVLLFTGAGTEQWSRWYLDHPARKDKLFSTSDTTIDFDNKIDAAMVLHDERRARAFSDTLARLLGPRDLPTRTWFLDEFAILAYAQATVGDSTSASKSLTRMLELARKADKDQYPVRAVSADRVASVYVRLGDTRSAIAWLEAGLQSRYTMAWYATHSRLQALRGTPEWRRFVREHPQ